MNRRTCTGDAASHARLDRGKQEVPLPVVPDGAPASPPNPDLAGLTAEEAGRVLQEAGAIAADRVSRWAEPRLCEVVLTVVTCYPALAAGRLEHWVEENLDEALWLSTTVHPLTRAES